MSGQLRVVPAASVRQRARLDPVLGDRPGLVPVAWHAYARTDDDLTLILGVDLTVEGVTRVVGATVVETSDAVMVDVLALPRPLGDATTLAAISREFLVDLSAPLADRRLAPGSG
ncbi:MAG TPA: hypothetical protein VFX16_18335 [Pseudonocardiaceae bacterium]|nr:hypothetical protein [Pseudonocardiaceae bacterium]